MPATEYALSIKQPWATLLVHGLKTVEIRAWSTLRRGRVLIHAGRVPDERPHTRKLVPDRLLEQTQLLGGVIGSADLIDCRAYRTVESFQADQDQHLNDPSWFRLPVLYGFAFANPQPLPFRKFPGWIRFFRVQEADW
jgi:hypothetical protein